MNEETLLNKIVTGEIEFYTNPWSVYFTGERDSILAIRAWLVSEKAAPTPPYKVSDGMPCIRFGVINAPGELVAKLKALEELKP